MFRFSFRGRRAASESTESRTGGAPDLTPRPSDRALLRAVHTCEASAEPLDGDTPTPGGRPGGCPGRVRRHAHTRTDTAEAAGTTTPGDRTKPTARAPRRPIQVAVAAGPAVTVDHRIIHHPHPVPCAAASLSRATLDRGSLGGRRPRTGDDDDDTRARSIGHPGPMGTGSGVSASGGPGRAATGWTLDRTPSCRQMDPHAHPDQSQPIDRVRAVRMDGRISDLISSHLTPGARHPPRPRVRSFVPSQTARDQGYSATYWAHQPGLHPRGAH